MKTVIRAKLPVESKMFCGCKEGESCPVCKKEPGAFPILNKAVVEKAIALTLSFGCELNQYTLFDRVKTGEGGYDLISQYSHPIGKEGKLEVAEDRTVGMETARLYEGEDGTAWMEIIVEEKPLSEEEKARFEEKIENILDVLSIKEWNIFEEELTAPVSYLPDAGLPPVIISQWWTDQIAAKYPDLIHIEETEIDEDDIF